MASIDDLSGKTVHVRKASSYYESLESAQRDAQRRRQAARSKLVLVPDALEDEDMLEMLNAGLLQAMVVDDWKAKHVGAGAAQARGPRGHRRCARRRR